MHQVDFTNADVTAASFEQSDLHNAVFSNTILEKADFRSAYNFAIHPDENKLRKAKFSKDNLQGLLKVYKIDIS